VLRPQGPVRPDLVTGLLVERARLAHEVERARAIAHDEASRAEVEGGVRFAGDVADLAGQLELLAVHAVGSFAVSLPVGDAARRHDRPHPGGRRLVGAEFDGTVHELPALTQATTQLPVPPQRGDQPLGPFDRSVLDRPGDGRRKVVLVLGQAIEPASLVATGDLTGSRFGQGEERLGMPPAHRLGLSRSVEVAEGDGPDRLEHPEPQPAQSRTRIGDRDPGQQALLGQLEHVVEDVDRGAAVARGDLACLVEIEPALEDRQAAEQRPLVVPEEGDAPGDRSFQRPLAVGCVAPATAGERQPRGEPVPDRRERKQGDPRRGELDAQGQAVEVFADLPDRGRGGSRIPARAHRPRALDEESHGRAVTRRRPSRDGLATSTLERAQRVLVLAVHPQRRPRRHDDPQSTGRAQQDRDERRGVDDLLEVVEHEQRVELGEVSTDALGDRSLRALVDAERSGDRGGHVRRIVDRIERDQPGSIGCPLGKAAGELDGQARLADPAGSHDREQPPRGEQPACGLEVGLAAQEGGQAGRQVALPGETGSERREVHWQAGNIQLVEPLGKRNVLQGVAAEVPDRHAGGELRRHQRPRGIGQHDLATVPDGGDPRRPVHVEAAVVVAGEVGLAAVEAHPHAHDGFGRPRVRDERPLAGYRRRHGVAGIGKRREDRVALGADDAAAVALHDDPDEPELSRVEVVPARPEGRGEPHGALDVGAQEGHGPGGERDAVRGHGWPSVMDRNPTACRCARRGSPASPSRRPAARAGSP
jgi:hypothetical protein